MKYTLWFHPVLFMPLYVVLLLNILRGFILECNICFLPNLIQKQTKWYLVPGGAAVKNPPTMQEMQETWVPSLGQEDLLEEGMATHPSILAEKIPWTEEPDGLPTIHGITVGHN